MGPPNPYWQISHDETPPLNLDAMNRMMEEIRQNMYNRREGE